MDDRGDPVEFPVVDLLELLTSLGHPGQHPEQFAQGAHLLDRLHLFEELLESEGVTTGDLVGHALGLVGVECTLRLLDEREHVAHVEDAGGHAIGVEDLEVLHLLPDRGEHDRGPGGLAHGQGRTTACITIELGENHPVDAHAVLEGRRGLHRVLSDHGVDHKEQFVGLDGVPDGLGLPHQLLIDGQPASSVDDDHVVQRAFGLGQGVPGHLHRVTDAVARLRGVRRHPSPLSHDLQLVDGVRPLEVGGHQHRSVALIREVLGQLAGQCGLTGALQAQQHDHRGRLLRQAQVARLAAEDHDQFLVDDLHDLLRGVQARRDLLAHRAFLDAGCEGAHHRQGHVGFEQGSPDLTDGLVDVRLGQPSFAAQTLEGRGQAVGQGIEHRSTPRDRVPA